MKKMLVIPMIVIMLIIMSTSVMAATSLAEEIYNRGKGYGVTQSHKEKMERYFVDNPVTEEQRATVLAKVDECIELMDKNGIKDVTKLPESDLNTVKSKVKEAGSALGLQVSFNGFDFTVSKNGKTIGEYHVQSASVGSTSTSATTSSDKFIYTGSNSTLALSSVAMAAIALVAIVKLRKNA